MSVVLLRHGETDWAAVTAQGLRGAARDFAQLTPTGIQQAQAAAVRLEHTGARRIVSSPLTRAMQTAAVVSLHLGLQLEVDYDLREWVPDHTDTWTGPHQASIDAFTRHHGEWPDGRPQPWEPLSAVRDRAHAALARHEAAAGTETGTDLIVVTHEVVIHALTGQPHTALGQGRVFERTAQPKPTRDSHVAAG